jgi:hypothetical protein
MVKNIAGNYGVGQDEFISHVLGALISYFHGGGVQGGFAKRVLLS